ncbi:MAG: LacI family DNA-binding transcriptional regulator [Chloroflexi bacterium]|nr:LacI family DNA-binding transcriptional regulator [Chloroflexota bacterium]
MPDNVRRKADSCLIVALASGLTMRDAAKQAGVSEKTVARRLADPAFRRQVAAEKAAMIARATAMLADASTEAVTTLRRLLQAEAESVRLGAARSILELGVKLKDSQELEQRIAALEQLANNPTEIMRRVI